MAIKSFKEIIENKGYRINPEDRNIFEESDIQSFFGVSNNDFIEFILYDTNDNQLPIGEFGLVRYIPLTSQNIKDYFLVAEGTLLQLNKFPSEYFIDIQRLIKEAGYNSGIFKTQITLINKRLGSDSLNDKVWIQEISPSRTEIRVLPHKKGLDIYKHLKEEYNAFVNDLDFRDDIIRDVLEYIEGIDVSVISNYLKTSYSENWVQKLIQEYKIKDIDTFCTQIYNKFLEASIYEFTNRISDINDLNYGKPKPNKFGITLSKNDVRRICEQILVNILNKFLLVPNINFGSTVNEKIESKEELERILQRKTSDLKIDTKLPEQTIAVIEKNISKNSLATDNKINEIIQDVIKDDIVLKESNLLQPDDFNILDARLQPAEEIIYKPNEEGLFMERRFRRNPDFLPQPELLGQRGIQNLVRNFKETESEGIDTPSSGIRNFLKSKDLLGSKDETI